MKSSPQQPSSSSARIGILCCSAGWLLFFSAWMLMVLTDGRVVPGLHGPGSMGNFMLVVLLCVGGGAITALAAAATALAAFVHLSPRLRFLGLAPAACMMLGYLFLWARG